MDGLLLSVVVVTKNDRENIIASLDSIPPDLDCEILVQDAESSFDVASLLSGHRLSSKIRLEVRSDIGIYDGMNKAVSRARGDFVCFLNCGDLFTEFAGLGLSAVLRGLDADFHVVKFLADTPDNGTQVERASRLYFFRHMLNHQSLVYRRAVFSECQFDANQRIIADMRHFLESRLIDRVAYVDVVLIKYLGGGIATTNEMINQNWLERSTVWSWNIPIIQKLIISCGVFTRAAARMIGLYR
jgi:glycosyltransferase involved in cell wall biosynthesis